MNYDLFLYSKNSDAIPEKLWTDYFQSVFSHISPGPQENLTYENPETGVYFLLNRTNASMVSGNSREQEGASELSQALNNQQHFEGFTQLPFYFSLNFFRPRFFGLESFPLLEKVIEDIDLYVLNPQSDGIYESFPAKFDAGFFQAEWNSINEKMIIEKYGELDLEYLPKDKSNSMWWFSLHRRELINSLETDLYVPGYYILKRYSDGNLYTACVCPHDLPIILPPVDFVIINKKDDSSSAQIEGNRLVSYQEIMEELGSEFEDFEHEIPNLKVLRSPDPLRLEEQFRRLHTTATLSEFGQGLDKDSFVNIRPRFS